MQIPDLINGAFEAFGAFFVFNHCRVLRRDRCVRGVSLASTVSFTVWGLWNLYYYPHLGQLLSFCGSLGIVVANSVYIGMIVYYRRQEQRIT